MPEPVIGPLTLTDDGPTDGWTMASLPSPPPQVDPDADGGFFSGPGDTVRSEAPLADLLKHPDMPLPSEIVPAIVGVVPGPAATTAEEIIAENDRLTALTSAHVNPLEGIDTVRTSLGRTWGWDEAFQEINNLGRLEHGWAPSQMPIITQFAQSSWTDSSTTLLFSALSSGGTVTGCCDHPGSPNIHFHEDPNGPDYYSRGRRQRHPHEKVRGWWTWRGMQQISLGHAIAVNDGIFNLQGTDRHVTALNWLHRVSREERRMIEMLNDTQWTAWVADQVRSKRERELLEAARAEHVTIEEARRRKEAETSAVEETARKLLHSMLSAPDRQMLAAHGYFEVRGGKTGTRYRILSGHHGTRNVLELDQHGRPRRRLCAHPMGLPDSDIMLAQKLVLETNEDLFLATANVSAP